MSQPTAATHATFTYKGREIQYRRNRSRSTQAFLFSLDYRHIVEDRKLRLPQCSIKRTLRLKREDAIELGLADTPLVATAVAIP